MIFYFHHIFQIKHLVHQELLHDFCPNPQKGPQLLNFPKFGPRLVSVATKFGGGNATSEGPEDECVASDRPFQTAPERTQHESCRHQKMTVFQSLACGLSDESAVQSSNAPAPTQDHGYPLLSPMAQTIHRHILLNPTAPNHGSCLNRHGDVYSTPRDFFSHRPFHKVL